MRCARLPPALDTPGDRLAYWGDVGERTGLDLGDELLLVDLGVALVDDLFRGRFQEHQGLNLEVETLRYLEGVQIGFHVRLLLRMGSVPVVFVLL